MEERKCVGWQEQETSRLFSAVQEARGSGAPLRQVFEDLSVDLGRKPNSIRNYYYACLRNQEQNTPRVQAFIPFTEAETHDLLRQVLTGCGQGMSVRACVMRMADGDHSRMLRYQNKYRAILKHHPEMIAQVRQELLAEGVAAPAQGKNPPEEAESRAVSQLMAEPCVLENAGRHEGTASAGVGGGGKGAIAAFARSNARGAGFAADCVGERL